MDERKPLPGGWSRGIPTVTAPSPRLHSPTPPTSPPVYSPSSPAAPPRMRTPSHVAVHSAVLPPSLKHPVRHPHLEPGNVCVNRRTLAALPSMNVQEWEEEEKQEEEEEEEEEAEEDEEEEEADEEKVEEEEEEEEAYTSGCGELPGS